MTRPTRLVVVLGTATEVGKTWVAARLLTELRTRGATVSARKPLQSFDPASSEPTDATVLAAATGEPADAVCADERSYPMAMAPPMAAEVLARAVPDLAQLCDTLAWPSTALDVGLVETVGGVRSPLAGDGDSLDLTRVLGPDLVVVVADAGLGVIDSVRSAVAPLTSLPVLVHLNRFDRSDDLHCRNRDWLVGRDGLDVVTGVEALADRVLPCRGSGCTSGSDTTSDS